MLKVGCEENGSMTSFGGLACVWRKLSGHHPQDVGDVTQVIKVRLRTTTVYGEEEEQTTNMSTTQTNGRKVKMTFEIQIRF